MSKIRKNIFKFQNVFFIKSSYIFSINNLMLPLVTIVTTHLYLFRV